MFFKVPMLYADNKELNTELLPSVVLLCSPSGQTFCSHKSRVKKFLLEYQSEGDPEDWYSSNNILVNTSGPRKSARNVNEG